MAIISKIRQRLGVAVGVIAVGLVLFIVGGDILGPNSVLMGRGTQYVGTIAGERITLKEFNDQLETLRQNYTISTGQSPNEETLNALREQAWNFLIFKKAYQKEFDRLGIVVTDEELKQMVLGDSAFIHPQVRAEFTDPKTGIFNRVLLVEYLKNLEKMPAERRLAWKNFEESLRQDRLRSKYENIMRVSNYVTKAEAEKEYRNQNTKAEVEYVYIPFASIVDSTIKVTDEQLKEYLEQNKNKYKDRAIETRTIEYITFDISPSPQDSASFYKEIKDLAKQLAVSTSDSTFAITNSDINTIPYTFVSVDKLPLSFFQEVPTLLKGGVYGPFVEGRKNYKIFKVTDVKEDTNFYARASHILVKPASTSDKDKEIAREKAEKILKEIQDGASFTEMARKHSQDESNRDKGGDLGFFGRGRMVKSFDAAVFDVEDQIKVIPKIVETEFGYHIIKVTHPKTNKLYKLAVVERILEPSDATRDAAYRKAEELVSKITAPEQFKAAVAKNPSLVLKRADKMLSNATFVNDIPNAREVVRWAFNDAKVNSISPVITLQEQNQYLIATLVAMTEKDKLDIDFFREELTAEVRKKIKAERILAKVPKTGTPTEIAKTYGKDAIFNTANDVALGANVFGNVGYNPLAIGYSLGLKAGQQTAAFADETGVFVIKLKKITPAVDVADYSQYKNNLLQSLLARTAFLVNEAIKEAAAIVDERYKFY
ncbi:MAG: peptidylprolyl isomerase [Cytophagales bacterium]|nr:MAG: peptidylprolyl isomerase [Cytophagales bacterium]